MSPGKTPYYDDGQQTSEPLALYRRQLCGNPYRFQRKFAGTKFARIVCAALSSVVPFTSLSVQRAFAQDETPQITVERKVERKKDNGPRAVAVLQLNAKGKASLVPVAILINGKFWDASSYKADPVPMALENGTVYEAERSGNSLGLFTVGSALHSNAVNAANPWLGTGSWVPGGVGDSTKAPMKAENVPVGIDTGDQPPRLTKNPAAAKPASPPAASPASSSPPASSPPASSDPDAPPRLIRPPSTTAPDSSSQSGSAQPGSSQSGSTQAGSQAGSSPPTTAPASSPPSAGSSSPDAKSGNSTTQDKTPEPRPQHVQGPASDSGIDEATRPRLRRGKPAAAPPDEEDIPGYSKVGAKPSATAKVATAADQGPIESIPAISDAKGPQPRSFNFEWLKDEEGEKKQQMIALAKEQVRAYLDAQAKARMALVSGPKTASASASRRNASKTTPKSPEPILEDIQMIAYDLWNSNQPIIVFSAEAHLPPPPTGAPHSETDAELRYSVTLVAYPDIYNNLHKLYVGVTDKYHLDLTPRLDLIDALDADGDGLGELLFKETSDAGSGWAIYRATGDKLWKMYDSLNPE